MRGLRWKNEIWVSSNKLEMLEIKEITSKPRKASIFEPKISWLVSLEILSCPTSQNDSYTVKVTSKSEVEEVVICKWREFVNMQMAWQVDAADIFE
jgi:hypothetical protein